MHALAFELSEYKERLAKTKLRMVSESIDLLISTLPHNMYYLTGYDCVSFYVHQGVIVHLEAEEPIWFGRGMDSNGARITTWLKEENICDYSDYFVQSSERHPMNFVADLLKEKGWDRARIGVEMDQYYFTAGAYLVLKEDLPEAQFRNSSLLVNWVRLIKSDAEVAYMKQAGQIVTKAMKAAIDAIRPDVRQCDVAAEVLQAQMRGTQDFGGEYTAAFPIMASGVGTTAAHMSWSDAAYKSNEISYLEIAGCRRRYHAPLARTIFLGKPPVKLEDIAKTVVDGLNKTLGVIKPGVSCEQVESAWRGAIAASGMNKKHRIAYSIGIGFPPDRGEHTASMRPGDHTLLEPNMTFHIIPAIWAKLGEESDSAFIISESFVVTENGCETFADVPRELLVR